jgi:hypothetical protein
MYIYDLSTLSVFAHEAICVLCEVCVEAHETAVDRNITTKHDQYFVSDILITTDDKWC